MMPEFVYTDKGERRELALNIEADELHFACLLDHPQGKPDEALAKGCLWYLIGRILRSIDHQKPQAIQQWLERMNWQAQPANQALKTCRILILGIRQVQEQAADDAPQRCEALADMAEELYELVRLETEAA